MRAGKSKSEKSCDRMTSSVGRAPTTTRSSTRAPPKSSAPSRRKSQASMAKAAVTAATCASSNPRSLATLVMPRRSSSASTGTLCHPADGALAYGTPSGISPRSTMIRPSAGSQRASAPIVPTIAANAAPTATTSSSGPIRAEAAATRARNAEARGSNSATIAMLPVAGLPWSNGCA